MTLPRHLSGALACLRLGVGYLCTYENRESYGVGVEPLVWPFGSRCRGVAPSLRQAGLWLQPTAPSYYALSPNPLLRQSARPPSIHRFQPCDTSKFLGTSECQ